MDMVAKASRYDLDSFGDEISIGKLLLLENSAAMERKDMISRILATSLILSHATTAGIFSGKLLDLQGNPINGAKVSVAGSTVLTGKDGGWTLTKTSSVHKSYQQIIWKRNTITYAKGHIYLTYGNTTMSGRSGNNDPVSNIQINGFSTRSSAHQDTLTVHWNEKRLITMPLGTADSNGILLKMDTSWGSDFGIPWNHKANYGTLHDPRDGHVYRTLEVGNRTWMAENLTYIIDSSWFYRNNDSYTKYGRLYTWAGAMELPDSCIVKNCALTNKPRKGVCPTGWIIPTTTQWLELWKVAGDSTGYKLKSVSDWPENGVDAIGFRALPGLNRYFNGSFDGAGGGSWWTSVDYNELYAESIYMYGIHASGGGSRKQYALSVRCILE